MNIELLRYFCAIADAGSLSKASESFYVSQQGLSKAVKSLEKTFGTQLLVRSKTGVRLTDDGLIVLRRARRIVEEYDGVSLDINARREDELVLRGAGIKLLVTPICMLTAVDQLTSRGHLGEVILREAETASALQELGDADWLHLVDLASNEYPLSRMELDYDIMPLLEVKIGIIARRDLFPNLPATISPEEASQLPLGMGDTPTTKAMYDYIFSGYQPRNVKTYSRNRSSLYEGMMSGRYAMISDTGYWEQLQPAVRSQLVFALIDVDLTSTFAFIRAKSSPMSERQAAFVSSFARAFEAL